MDHWEYKVLAPGGVIKGIKPEGVEAQLNELGQEGWELVSMGTMENTGKLLIVLKRRIAGHPAKNSGTVWGKW